MTAKKTEQYLNTMYSDSYTENEVIDLLIYLTNKNRGRCTTVKAIKKHYQNGTIGTLIRKYDSIAFNCIKSDLR